MSATNGRIVYAAPDVAVPTGGIRVLYRHVEMLTAAGYDAFVWHHEWQGSPTWFDTAVPIRHGETLELSAEDLLVLPEGFVLGGTDPAPGCRKVIFNQNHFNTFSFSTVDDYPRLDPPAAVWVVSQASGRIMERLLGRFGLASIEYLPCAIDTALFRPATRRRRKVVWMPRKRPFEAALIHALLIADPRLQGAELTPVDGRTEAETAAELADASVFIALGRDEGFGLPVAEALAAGCAVVGYPSGGGAELFEAPGAYAVNDSDVLAIVELVARLLEHGPGPDERRRFRSWVERRYSEDQLLARLERAVEHARRRPALPGAARHPWPELLRLHSLR